MEVAEKARVAVSSRTCASAVAAGSSVTRLFMIGAAIEAPALKSAKRVVVSILAGSKRIQKASRGKTVNLTGREKMVRER
jgi:hypothetical protein